MCYQVNMNAYCVIVMDTQHYNGKHHVYEDYPVGEILQMVGMANRPGVDEDGKHSPEIGYLTLPSLSKTSTEIGSVGFRRASKTTSTMFRVPKMANSGGRKPVFRRSERLFRYSTWRFR